MVLLLSAAGWSGCDRRLAAVTEPALFGAVRTVASLSLLATDQPAGTGMVTPSFDSVLAPDFGVAVGDPTGVGVPTGLGLESSGEERGLPFVPLLERLPMIASAVPHPAIKTTRATMAAMISTQGVRCTGGTGPVGM